MARPVLDIWVRRVMLIEKSNGISKTPGTQKVGIFNHDENLNWMVFDGKFFQQDAGRSP